MVFGHQSATPVGSPEGDGMLSARGVMGSALVATLCRIDSERVVGNLATQLPGYADRVRRMYEDVRFGMYVKFQAQYSREWAKWFRVLN